MRLMQIKYFLAVADYGSITKAAELMFVSQPGLSKQLHLLEEELGTKLMERRPRGIVLTDAGISFAGDCRRILAELDEAVNKATEVGKIQNKVFRIGCFDGAVIEDFMPGLYRHLHEKGYSVRLTRNNIRENRDALRSGSIDLLIELQFPDQNDGDVFSDCSQYLLVSRKGALIYSVNSPLAQLEHLTLKNFEKEPLLIPNPVNNLHLASHNIECLKALGIRSPKIEEVDNLISIMTNITLGNGYSIMAADTVRYNNGLLAYEIPDPYGILVIAVWKNSNPSACSFMKSFIRSREHCPETES